MEKLVRVAMSRLNDSKLKTDTRGLENNYRLGVLKKQWITFVKSAFEISKNAVDITKRAN